MGKTFILFTVLMFLFIRVGEVNGQEEAVAKPGDLIIRHEGKTLGPIGIVGIQTPHIGIYTGNRDKDGISYDVIDLGIEKGNGVIRPSHWTDESRFKDPGFYSVLDSRIPIRYNDEITTLSALPEKVKSNVREKIIKMADDDLGSTYGKYELHQFSKQRHSVNCGDWVLDLYNKALTSEGIQVMSHRFPGSHEIGATGLKHGEIKDYAELLWGTTDPSALPGWLPQVSPPNTFTQNPGGVYIDPQPSSTGKANPDIKQKVLESRPSEDAGSWTVEMVASPKPLKGRAISLRVLQEKVKDCMTGGTCSDDIIQLAGMTKISGYVIDEKNKDLILIGKADSALPPLHLEDFVIALRNTWLHYAGQKGNTRYYSPPGCSIDPNPGVIAELQQLATRIFSSSDPDDVQKSINQWRSACGQPQQVRVLGIPFDTRFAKVMVEADYYMKRLVDGSVTLDIDGFTSLTDMTLNIVREDIEKGESVSIPLQSMHRFWFYPGENSFLVDKGIVLIDKSKVNLLTEDEFLVEGGKMAGTGSSDPLADKFVRSFSEKYDAIAKIKPIYAELEGLFRSVALTKLMKYNDAVSEAGISLDYMLKLYSVRNTPVNRTLPGISNVKEFNQRNETAGGYSELYLWLPSCGGVSIDIKIKESDIAKDKTGSLVELKEAVLKARLSQDALYWDFMISSSI